MRNAKEASGTLSAGGTSPRMRSRFFKALGVFTCALTMPGLSTIAFAQSPFTQPPSPSGSFTIPLPTPLPTRREGTLPPSGRPPRPGAPLRPLPGGVTPTRPGERTPMPPLPPPGNGPLGGTAQPLPTMEPPRMLPIPLPGEEVPTEPAALPPGPEIAPPLTAASTAPIPPVPPITLRTGLRVTLRISRLLPVDGLSPGERLLNSRPALQAGDCFLAEIVNPCPPYPILVGGTVTRITPPGHFGRPGYVSLQMRQVVQTVEGQPGWLPWQMDTADRRFTTRMRRVFLTTLLGLEGAGTGASIGAQFSTGNMAFIGGGMGIGAIVGLAYASFQRGTEAYLEPGDTFEIVVGTTEYRPVSREWQTILYPAAEPSRRKPKKP